jgi:hypothetical protein
LGIVTLVSACSGINRPFSRDKSWLGTRDPQAPPVTITQLDGVPQATAARLAGQVYTESRRRGFSTTMNGEDLDGFVVTGSMSAAPTAHGTTVVYVWDVWDPSRRHQFRISGEETIPGAAYADPWNAVDDSAMQRIASETSEQLAGFISNMGYEVRMASVPPPAGMLSDAADSITTASITGTLHQAPSSALAEADRTASLSAAQPAYSAPAAAPAQAAPASSGQVAMASAEPVSAEPAAGTPTAIVVPLVVGASGQGNNELAQAMRQAMARSGLPITDQPRDGALSVVGEVNLDRPQGNQQAVALNWRVLDQDGALIGTIAQNNQVAAGSLDGSWGPAAQYAAEAAAGGIFQLLSGGQ